NPQSYAIALTLRINDMSHEQGSSQFRDRFNRNFEIRPGLNRIYQDLGEVATAPKDRRMDMDEIRRLMFFTTDLSQPARLCLGELSLRD
ncbi:MAG TPA: succinyl-CoA synthetase subunit beta, partial [Marinobacter sp.]|nr:succinyl-CoA synthetase subunit beta [Marinobacter sp.]